MPSTTASKKGGKKSGKAKAVKNGGIMKPESRPKRMGAKFQQRVQTALTRRALDENELRDKKTSQGTSRDGDSYLIQTDLALKNFSATMALYATRIAEEQSGRHRDAVNAVQYARAVQIYNGEDNFPATLAKAWNEFVGDDFEDYKKPASCRFIRQQHVETLRTTAGSMGLYIPDGMLFPETHVYGSFMSKPRDIVPGPAHNNGGRRARARARADENDSDQHDDDSSSDSEDSSSDDDTSNIAHDGEEHHSVNDNEEEHYSVNDNEEEHYPVNDNEEEHHFVNDNEEENIDSDLFRVD
ncbi:hypothetical protein ONZ43_g2631 [Nemania bipapillata]|uniref:Uncharacterized protein n=1 Tax=Nemania bipapillata TaxID=110536 RepID=A0ACC2J026_9PEZI|nr:hypothetical protein ONZ43_g2631 [Nemania bipapillata]